MVSTIGLHHAADLSYFQTESYVFEGFLHVSAIEMTEVSSSLATGAFRVLDCEVLEGLWLLLQLLPQLVNELLGVCSASGDWLVPVGIEGPAGFLVLGKDVCAPH